jgi:hypothetical protein
MRSSAKVTFVEPVGEPVCDDAEEVETVGADASRKRSLAIGHAEAEDLVHIKILFIYEISISIVLYHFQLPHGPS